MTGSTDVGELIVRIKADIAQLQSGMSQASSVVKHSSNEMTAALGEVKTMMAELGIVVSIGAFVEFEKSALEAANSLYILGQRTGIAASTLSALNIPLKQNGSSVEEFANSVKFMSRNIETASPATIKAFDNIGLSITKLRAMTPEEQFYAITTALSKVTDQSKFVADGMAIFGRSFVTLAPLIKESGGNLEEYVKHIKNVGEALTEDEIKKVHEYDDAWISFWEHMKIHAVEATIKLHDFFTEKDKFANNPDPTDGGTHWPGQPVPTSGGPSWMDGGTGGRGLTKQQQQDAYIARMRAEGAKNAPAPIQQSFAPDPNIDAMLGLNQSQAPQQSFATGNLSDSAAYNKAKGNNNDLAGPTKVQVNELNDYIKALQNESAALGESKVKLDEVKAIREATTKASTDYNNGLRESAALTDDEKQKIIAAVDEYDKQRDALEKLNQEKQKQIAVAAQMEAAISSSLADIALNYKSFGDTITKVMDQIAKKLIEDQITTPFVNSLGQMFGAPDMANKNAQAGAGAGIFSGIAKMLGFAGGGNPPVGVPSIVGENGPEIFIPSTPGTVLPNGASMGSNVTVQQTNNFMPGLEQTIYAAMANVMPQFAAATHASVMQAIQKGGQASQIVGRRG